MVENCLLTFAKIFIFVGLTLLWPLMFSKSSSYQCRAAPQSIHVSLLGSFMLDHTIPAVGYLRNCESRFIPGEQHLSRQQIYLSPPHGETLGSNLVTLLQAALDVPVKGYGHVASPGGIPA